MRKSTLLKALFEPDSAFNSMQPPGRAVFSYDEEIGTCASIVKQLTEASLSAQAGRGNRHAVPLPDVDLPLIF
ncbi:hypothetical protein [Paraburkholderia megapolitana]|uniref:hypothetical protein n=1 Tax=Paraburkholderia megapolitana TaxID=420953 RepID=UPI0038BB5E71